MFDSRVMLLGEFRCLSLLGVKWFIRCALATDPVPPPGQHNNILSSLSRRLTSVSRAESTHLVLKQCSTSDGSSPNSSSELKISLVSEKEEPQG